MSLRGYGSGPTLGIVEILVHLQTDNNLLQRSTFTLSI